MQAKKIQVNLRSTYFHTFAKKNPFSAWTGRHLFLVLVLNNTYHCRIEKPNQQVFCNQNSPTVLTVQWTEVRFTSFLSGGFITAIVVNPPERKLAKRTSVQWCSFEDKGPLGSGVDFCSKISSRQILFSFEFHKVRQKV